MTNTAVDSQVCAVILHEFVLIINENQKGKECIQQKRKYGQLGGVQVLNLCSLSFQMKIMDVAWCGLGTAAVACHVSVPLKTAINGSLQPRAAQFSEVSAHESIQKLKRE